jgi:hypothetical protein
MNAIEDRIRAAARAAADTVAPDSVPPLRLPARPARRSWSFGSAWTRRLAPAMAAVAVAVVAIVGVTVSRAVHDSAAAPNRAAPGTIASFVAAGQVPRYYIAISISGTSAAVRATATGRTLATIAPPTAGDLIAGVSAAADDRTFILDERLRDVGINSGRALTFYKFRLDSAGRPGPLSPLLVSVPENEIVAGFALSPDADKLAVAWAPDPDHSEVGIQVFTLATGAVQTWTATYGGGFDLATVGFLSWTQDERTLAFSWNGSGTRLLNPDAPSGNLDTASRAAFGGTGQGWACAVSAMITPDGKTLVCGARVRTSVSVSNDQIGYAEYGAASGKLERVLGQRLAGPQGPTLGWMNASGSVLIGGVQTSPNASRLVTGLITSHGFVPLPGAPELSFLHIAW